MTAGLSAIAVGVPRSGIRDVFDRAEEIPGVISLALGEPADAVPEHAAAAGAAAIARSDTHYTDVLGIPAFRRAAVDYTRRTKRLVYDADTEAHAVPGATFGLYLALRSLVDPGDEVIVPSPHFTSYNAQVLLCQARPVTVPLRPERGMRLDADDIARAITPRTKAILVNSPGNPTGAVTGVDELARIAALCREHGIWAISDEVYHAFVYGAAVAGPAVNHVAPSIAAFDGMHERTIIVESLSKTYAMTGWRIGYLLGPAEIIEETAKLAELVHSSNNTPAQFAGAVALDDLDVDIGRMRARYARRREIVLDALADAPVLHAAAPEGAFYAFVDVRGTGLGSAEFAARLLDAERVAVVPGETFGEAGHGFVRLSYAGSTSELEEGMRRLARFAERAS